MSFTYHFGVSAGRTRGGGMVVENQKGRNCPGWDDNVPRKSDAKGNYVFFGISVFIFLLRKKSVWKIVAVKGREGDFSSVNTWEVLVTFGPPI